MSSTAAPLTLRRSLALVWRSLRSMRTALILLLLLALAAIAGSLVPQQGTSPATVAAMFQSHPLRADIYNAVGLFDVFGSWWFTLIYVLLLVSLGACLLPRTRAFVRNARIPPQPARELDALRHHAERAVALAPDRAIDRSEHLLRRKLFRVRRIDGALAAEKGIAREGGSLVFHWAFFLVLLGVIIGKGTGFTGYAVITEGQCWTDAAVNYDGNLQQGRFASIEDHTGIQICVKSFEDTYFRSGLPMDFVTTAEFRSPSGESLGEQVIRVNHPASIDGISAYQNAFGWAPVVQVHQGSRLIASGPLQFEKDPAPKGMSDLALPWHGALRLPTTDPQTGLQFVLWPDGRAFLQVAQGGQAPMMTTANHPLLILSAYRGDLASEIRPQSAQLDTRGLAKWGRGQLIEQGRTVDLDTGALLPRAARARPATSPSRSPGCASTRCSRSAGTEGCGSWRSPPS